MCGTGNDNSSNDSGGGDKDDKPAKKKKNIIKEIFTPTPESIAKNKVAGAKHTASQKAKGIGVARSNFTSGDGTRIKGVANSETNPALVRLAKQGKRGAEGLNELARQQSAASGKDTSFTGVFNSLMSGEKHSPRQSLLEFGKTQGLPNTGPPSQGFKEGTSSIKAASPRKRVALTIGKSSGGGGSSGGSNQDTALAGGSAGRTSDVNNKKNMLAVNRKVRAKGKKGTRNMSGLAYSSKGTGLNIST